MGYTHYFRMKSAPSQSQWGELTASLNKIVSSLPESSESAGGYYNDHMLRLVPAGSDNFDALTIDSNTIRFNGAGEMSHESFSLSINGDEMGFCKTNRKPYDLVVCCALILAEHYAPGCWSVSTDGDAEDWIPALALVRSVLDDNSINLPKSLGPAAEDKVTDFIANHPPKPKPDAPRHVWF